MISTELHRQTNEPVVTETRVSAPWRALPRPVRDRVVSLDTAKTFLVRYQDFVGRNVSAVRCWKCGTPIIAYAPVLRRIDGGRAQEVELTKVMVGGQELLLGALLPMNHYREGLFTFRAMNGALAAFSYLHCADCHIANEHGEDLLACHLGGLDRLRDTMKDAVVMSTDDAWAQFMYRWSGIELVGLSGPSKSPSDLMNEMKKGPR
jgi:hypothetical protein